MPDGRGDMVLVSKILGYFSGNYPALQSRLRSLYSIICHHQLRTRYEQVRDCVAVRKKAGRSRTSTIKVGEIVVREIGEKESMP